MCPRDRLCTGYIGLVAGSGCEVWYNYFTYRDLYNKATCAIARDAHTNTGLIIKDGVIQSK